ncbi:MAG: LD-carboxypeptidase [Christensenellaceae bacterium]|nr:LD-carboxypeptidase [Christensenellaceae bacterium]
MNIPKKLKQGDTLAIVSLSAGTLGEPFCKHNVDIATKRIKDMGLIPLFMPHSLKGIEYVENHPEKRAEDLKAAFLNPDVKGIISAIGGIDTFKTLPYLMEDNKFIEAVNKSPKIFTGFSNTTVNHLMFYKLGMQSYYGPAVLTDIADIGPDMLPYTREAFNTFFENNTQREIKPSPVWYEERTDFSINALGSERIAHKETSGFELLQGPSCFSGELLGGCLESLYEMIASGRQEGQLETCQKYKIFPSKEEWENKIMFLETSENCSPPEYIKTALEAFKAYGIFDVVSGILVGKPQNEIYYEEYKHIYRSVVPGHVPILYNVNFGHAYPRTVLPYGKMAYVDSKRQIIEF